MSVCRTCRAEYVAGAWEIAKYDFQCKPCRRAARKDFWRKNSEIRRKDAAYNERQKIWNRVWHEAEKGNIQRQPCEVCGNMKAQAHHDDYSKPLEVRWLCAVHHRQHHLATGAA